MITENSIKKNRAEFIEMAIKKGISEHQLWSWFNDKRKLEIINALCARESK